MIDLFRSESIHLFSFDVRDGGGGVTNTEELTEGGGDCLSVKGRLS